MGEHLELLALVCELKHLHAAEVVNTKGVLKGVIEVYRGCAVYQDLDVVSDQGSVNGGKAELVHDQVSSDRHYFAGSPILEVWDLLSTNGETIGA